MLAVVLVHEREPPTLANLPEMTLSWLQDAGALAAAALLLWFLSWLVRRTPIGLALAAMLPRPLRAIVLQITQAGSYPSQQYPRWVKLLFTAGLCLTGLAYLNCGLAALLDSAWKTELPSVAGAAALFTAFLPFLHGLTRLSGRRIFALASLTFKEAIRSKVLWVTGALLPFFLFADWFLPHRPDSQLQVYIEAVFLVMTILFLIVPTWLASFSIPSDIRQQTIHTVVTKPVERFEIVLGRFLGYVGLMTLWLVPMTAAALVYVLLLGVHPDAAEQSMRARVPVYGTLELRGERQQPIAGGQAREWTYRRYIAGGPASPERALWRFTELPTRLESRGQVPCEFAFDIFRTIKGEGVFCTLTFASWRWHPGMLPAYQNERDALLRQGQPEADVDAALAERYGYYEVRYKQVVDYHTFQAAVPAELFRHAAAKSLDRPVGEPLVNVSVKCESRSTYLGVARYDLYLLDGEGSFVANLFKGAAGIWLRICLVAGLAVTFSTYLSGIISFLLTCVLYLFGVIKGFVLDLALNQGGVFGPSESFLRLVNRTSISESLEETPINQVALGFDEAFRVFLTFFTKLIPDVDRFSLTSYVAAGFDIPAGLLAVLALMLAGYLLPCAMLAYYLMQHREIGG